LNAARLDTFTVSGIYLTGPDGLVRAQYIFPDKFVRTFGDQSGLAAFNPRTQEYLAAASWEDENYQSSSGYLVWKPGSTPRLISLACNRTGSFSEDATLFACHSGQADDVLVWNTSEEREVARWKGEGETSTRAGELTFFDEGRGLAVEEGEHDSSFRLNTTIRLYEVASHTIVAEYRLGAIEKRPNLSSQQLGRDGLMPHLGAVRYPIILRI